MHQCHFGMVLHDSNSFRSGREMEPTYDIFKRRVGDYPFWIVAVDSLEEARERMLCLRQGNTSFTRKEKGSSLSASPRCRNTSESDGGQFG
jgi:hypothetical protein